MATVPLEYINIGKFWVLLLLLAFAVAELVLVLVEGAVTFTETVIFGVVRFRLRPKVLPQK
jgi:hypothetical protein